MLLTLHSLPFPCLCTQFVALDLFVRNYFARIFVIIDDMKLVHTSGACYKVCHPHSPLCALCAFADSFYGGTQRVKPQLGEHDSQCHGARLPSHYPHGGGTRALLSRREPRDPPTHEPLSHSHTHRTQILGYMQESLDSRVVPPEPVEQNGRALYDRLQILDLATELRRRVVDLAKNMSGARHEFEVLREMSNVVSETKLFKLHESVDVNTRNLCQLQEANERASTSLEIMYAVCV